MRRLLLVFSIVLAVPASRAQTFTKYSPPFPAGSAIGVTIADLDGDGRIDILADTRRAYRWRNGTFSIVPYRFPSDYRASGVLVGDSDGDGLPNLAILDLFEPSMAEYDLARSVVRRVSGTGITVSDFITMGSTWLDYDGDGALDLFFGNDAGPDYLFCNDGDGAFEDVSGATLPSLERGTYGAASADFDRDGDPDIYIGLCTPVSPLGNNLLYRNDDGTFAEAGGEAGVSDEKQSWGVVWLDFDNDGWLDLFVANMASNPEDLPGFNTLYRNERDGTFTDVSEAAGIAGFSYESSWSAGAADFDNDGWIDFFVSNGTSIAGDPVVPSRLYRNNGDGTFTDMAVSAGLSDIQAQGFAVGDVNSDGWVDLFVAGDLYFNDGGTNGWLSVDLTGTASNRDGIGARVEVSAGDLSMVREITAGDGFMSQSHGLRAHFGLGTAASADVTVRWPSGAVETITGVAANQEITVVEGLGINQPPAMFGLTTPVDDALVPLGESVTLAWEAATDPESDPVAYTVYLAAPDSTDVTFETTEPTLTIPASALVAEGEYGWAVVASDGHTPRTSLDPFRFIVSPDVASGVEPEQAVLSLAVWPNPARDAATVRFTVPEAEAVTLEVVDALGRRVRSLDFGAKPAGAHEAQLDMSRLGAGVYVVRVVGSRSGVASARLVRIGR